MNEAELVGLTRMIVTETASIRSVASGDKHTSTSTEEGGTI
jgi:hypothetical protein